MTDWNLVIQSNISLLWLNECMKKSNQNKKVEDLMKEFQARNENVGILNSGTLMMASYFLFLYRHTLQPINKTFYTRLSTPSTQPKA